MTDHLTFAAETAEHAEMAPFPILVALIVLPAVGALTISLISARRTEYPRLVATLFTGATGALSIWMLASFETGVEGFQFFDRYDWIERFGISFSMGVDGISLFLVVLTGVIFPIAVLGSTPSHDPKPYYAWLLLLEAGSMGVFVALDLFMFFVFFEIVLVPMYFLIGGWGHGNRVYASVKFFLYTMAGSAMMLVAVIATAVLHASGADSPVTFDVITIAERAGGVLSQNEGRLLFLAFALAFAVKVPIFPVHTWLPDAHTEAPTAGSVILAAVMLKLGTYGFLRYGLFLFPEAANWAAPTIVTLGVVGMLYGAVVAAMQRDLKRLVAYSSVAHLGFIILGTFSFTQQGITGGILQMVNHGISTGALFLLVGMLYERRHTREIERLGGIWKVAPVFGSVFLLVAFSSIGLPGLNGFVGEFLILVGSFLTLRWWTVVGAAGVILAALYLLWAFQRVFQGEPEGDNADTPEMTWSEGLVLAPLVGLIVFLGVYPKPMIERIEPAVAALVSHVEDRSTFTEPEVARLGPAGASVQLPEEGATSGDDHTDDHAGSGAAGDEADHSEEGS